MAPKQGSKEGETKKLKMASKTDLNISDEVGSKIKHSSKKQSVDKEMKTKGGADAKHERYFKLIDAKTLQSYGRYTGDTPKQAASKGFTKILQGLKKEGKTPIKDTTIYLRESTRGSPGKVYGYLATRNKLSVPQELEIQDKTTGVKKTITYNYRNNIHKVDVPGQIGGSVKKPAKKRLAKDGITPVVKKTKTGTVKKTGSKKSSKTGSKKSTKTGSKKSATKTGSKKSAKKTGSKKSAKKTGSKKSAKKM